MFPSVFYTHSCHTSQELGLMGTKSLPCFFRALLLWQWYFPPFSPLSHKHLTIPQPTGEQSASRDCYFGFCWPLVGQLCFWLLSWLHSPGDVAFIVWILKDSREEFLSLKSPVSVWSVWVYQWQLQNRSSLYVRKYFCLLFVSYFHFGCSCQGGFHSHPHYVSPL